MTHENEVPSAEDLKKAKEICQWFPGSLNNIPAWECRHEKCKRCDKVASALSALRASLEKEKYDLLTYGANQAETIHRLEAEKKGLEERVKACQEGRKQDFLNFVKDAERLKAENESNYKKASDFQMELAKSVPIALAQEQEIKIDTLTCALAEAREALINILNENPPTGYFASNPPIYFVHKIAEKALNNPTSLRASEEMKWLRAIASDVKILLDEHGQSEAHIKYGRLGCEILNKVKALEAYESRGRV